LIFDLISAYAKASAAKGAVAQLVEQRTENPCVGGSIPPHTTALKTSSAMMGFFCFGEVGGSLFDYQHSYIQKLDSNRNILYNLAVTTENNDSSTIATGD
jgi:hypothetical protein